VNAHTHRFSLAFVSASFIVTVAVATITAARSQADEQPTMYVCRTSAAGETANATMSSTKVELICHPVALALKMSGGSLRTIGRTTAGGVLHGPDLSKALTPQQINDAYVEFIERTFHIDHNS